MSNSMRERAKFQFRARENSNFHFTRFFEPPADFFWVEMECSFFLLLFGRLRSRKNATWFNRWKPTIVVKKDFTFFDSIIIIGDVVESLKSKKRMLSRYLMSWTSVSSFSTRATFKGPKRGSLIFCFCCFCCCRCCCCCSNLRSFSTDSVVLILTVL